MSAIRSASSMTTRPTSDRSATLRSIRSMSGRGWPPRSRRRPPARRSACPSGRRRRRRRAAGPGLDQGPQHVGDLQGQLAGGDEHEAGGPLRGRGGDPLDQGEAEREGLARAGLGLAAHVAAGQGVGDAEALDGESCRQARSVEHGHQIRGHAQRRERLLFIVAHGSGRAYRPVRSGPFAARVAPGWSAGGHVVAALAHVHDVDQAGEAADGVLAEPAVGQALAGGVEQRRGHEQLVGLGLVAQAGREVDRAGRCSRRPRTG